MCIEITSTEIVYCYVRFGGGLWLLTKNDRVWFVSWLRGMVLFFSLSCIAFNIGGSVSVVGSCLYLVD